jgi:hypothetical protein
MYLNVSVRTNVIVTFGPRKFRFQERFLAPRTLHFTTSQVYWECRTGCACEIYPTAIPERLCQGPEYLPKLNAIPPLKLWPNVEMIYSRCMLTYQKDKLIALSGVARYVQNRLADDYVWKHNHVGDCGPASLGREIYRLSGAILVVGLNQREDNTQYSINIPTPAFTFVSSEPKPHLLPTTLWVK